MGGMTVPLSSWDKTRAEAVARRRVADGDRRGDAGAGTWRRSPLLPIDGELVTHLPVHPQRPAFNYVAFERECQRVREEIELLMDHDYLPDAGTAYTARLDVLKGYFKSYAAGLLREDDVIASVITVAEELQDTPHGGLLALDVSKVGFLEMYRLDLAARFAAEVDRRLSHLRGMKQQSRPHLPGGHHADAV